MKDINNTIAELYRPGKAVSELTDDELIKLGKSFAEDIVLWTTDESYEPWEFSSEEMPMIVQNGLDAGLIRERRSHTETIEKIVFDE